MKMTQKDRIIQYLDENGSISQFEAFTELGIMRLASRISELKRLGHRIIAEVEEHTNRYGEKVHCTRYKKDQQERKDRLH